MATGHWPAFLGKKMKKRFLLIVLLAFSQFVFANPNYKNGNGTIISSVEKDGVKTTIRKCIINNVKIREMLQENSTIYENYTFNKTIGQLKDGDIINVLEVCTIEYLNNPKDKWGTADCALWFKIQLKNLSGCICVCKQYLNIYCNPYYENRYEILGEIQASKKWTVRKLEQTVAVWEKLNVRDKPGLDGKKVFLLHNFEPGTRDPQENYEILAITEETETIDGLTDHWLKIEYAPQKYGWIFGGYVTVERGGVKYYIPEHLVISYLHF